MKKILAVVALVLAFPVAASAKGECTSNTDCQEGYECVVALCACAPCAPDTECLPCDCGGGVCMESGASGDPGGGVDDVWYSSECAADSDCPMDFVCETMAVGCASAACPPCMEPDCPDGESCPEYTCEPCDPTPVDCVDTTTMACVYHPVECAADTDCPADYRCETYSTGGMSCGSCACACPAEGECPPCECDAEPTCVEEPGDTYGVCVPQEKVCETNTDCPEGWSCEIMAYDAGCGCTCAVPECDPSAGECAPVECPACDCPEPVMPTSGYCYPGGWGQIALDSATSNADDTEGPRAPGGVIPVTKGGEELSAQAPSETPIDTKDGSSSGCTTSTTGTPAASLLLLGLALALSVIRRRR